MHELVLILRLALVEMLLLSGGLKLLGFGRFRLVVENYRVLPAAVSGWAAGGVVTAELAAAAGLALGGVVSLPACLLLIGLLALLSGAMAVNLRRGRRIRCGCFGADSEAVISWRSVGRNLLLIAATTLVLGVHVSSEDARAWGGLLPSAVIASMALLVTSLGVEASRFVGHRRRLGHLAGDVR